MSQSHKWTEEQIKMVQDLVLKNYSRSMVANFINEKYGVTITRSSIAGLLHRNPVVRPTVVKKVKSISKKQNNLEPVKTIEPVVTTVVAEGISFDELTTYSCRYEISKHDTPASQFRFCGKIVPAFGVPYCSEHMKLSYVPARKIYEK